MSVAPVPSLSSCPPADRRSACAASSSRPSGCSAGITKVMLRRDPACDTMRSGMPSSAPTTLRGQRADRRAAARPRRRPAPCSSSMETSANVGKVADDLVQPVAVVDRHRHAHLGRRHHVGRRAMPLEHFEQPPQEAVRHEHARRLDVDDRHFAFTRDGRRAKASSSAP